MRRKSLFLTVFVFLYGILISSVQADMVVVAHRYFVDRSSIQGQFYTTGDKKGNNIVLRIQFGIAGGGWGKDYICQDKWNGGEKIVKATRDIIKYINKNDYIDPIKMLSNSGFKGCKMYKE